MQAALGIFLISSATLLLELVLIRVFEVIMYPNMAYMIITCALFAFGMSGIYGTLRPPPDRSRVHVSLVRYSVVMAVSVIAIFPSLNLIPFNFDNIAAAPFKQIVFFGAMYLSLIVPFFCSGRIIIILFSLYADKIRTLYFWDLLGAAIGSFLIVPLILPIGPGGLLFVIAGLAIIAAACFWGRLKISMGLVSVAIALILVPVLFFPEYIDFRAHAWKRSVQKDLDEGRGEFVLWDPVAKINVLRMDEKGRDLKHIAYDGGSQSSHIFRFDGDFKKIRENLKTELRNHFWNRSVLAAHFLKRDMGQNVLVIGSSGGQEVTAALMYGAGQVDAIEMVGSVVDLGKTIYSEYNGNIYNLPNVNYRVGEGRSYLRSTDKRYDIIQIYSNHTTSSLAQGAGAMDPVYLQTAEAYGEYFNHLSENGVLQINRFYFPRMVTTAALAWKRMGRKDFENHVVVFQRPEKSKYGNLPTLLIKMGPWTGPELDDLRSFFSEDFGKDQPQELIENPLRPDESFLSPDFYSGDFPSDLADRMSYRIWPTTDNRPYFNYVRKNLRKLDHRKEAYLDWGTAKLMNSQLRRFVPFDLIHLIVTGGLSLFFVGIFIFVPLMFSEIGREKWNGKHGLILYFSCLGAGFIIFELVFIQIFMKFIGYPLYTYTTVIFTILFGAGIGSFISSKMDFGKGRAWIIPFAGVMALASVILLSYGFIFDLYLSGGMALRVGVSMLIILPLAVFLGMPFPMGILAVKDHARGAIAWGWAMNSLFTVVGGFSSVLFSIYFGFQATLYLSIAIYGVAMMTYPVLLRKRVSGEARLSVP